MDTVKQQRAGLVISSLFLVLFVDGLGQGIVLPLLIRSLFSTSQQTLMLGASLAHRNMMFAVVVASFYVFWFFGGAVLGDVSDSLGRKKSLLVCLAGSVIGYSLCAFAFVVHNVWLLLLGRSIDGLTAGDQPIAQAAIIDITPPEKHARNIGMMLLSVTLGLILGPVFGGYLSEPSFVSWFNNTTPMWFAALLSALGFIGLAWVFTETNRHQRTVEWRVLRAFTIFKDALQRGPVRYLLTCFLLMQAGWQMFYLYMSAFLAHMFGYTATHIATFLAIMGVGLAVGSGLLPRICESRFSPKHLVVVGYGLCAWMALVALLVSHVWSLWVFSFLGAAGLTLAYTSFIKILSSVVSQEKQGWIMGVVGSIVAGTAGLDMLAVSGLMLWGVRVPMAVAFFMTTAGIILMVFFQGGGHSEKTIQGSGDTCR